MKYKVLIIGNIMSIFLLSGECGIFKNVCEYPYDFLKDNQ